MASTHPTNTPRDAHADVHSSVRTHAAPAGTARAHETRVDHGGTHTLSAEGDHVAGTMDVTAQQRTFNVFVRMVAWNVVAIIAVLIFLALTNA